MYKYVVGSFISGLVVTLLTYLVPRGSSESEYCRLAFDLEKCPSLERGLPFVWYSKELGINWITLFSDTLILGAVILAIIWLIKYFKKGKK